MRYWYDYDNRCYLDDIHIPAVPIRMLRSIGQPAMMSRHYDCVKYNAGEFPIAFEYSYCFKSAEEIWRKKCTYSHTGFTKDDIDIALKCNHWVRSPNRNERVGDYQYDFFEKAILNEQNSPKYVRDNLRWLKTNIIDTNYKTNRANTYPNLFK